MVETFGTNRGLTPSIGKGVERKYIRYNYDDKINEYSSGIENTKKALKNRTIAKIKDIEFYLGKDWIDWKVAKVNINNKSRVGTRFNSQPSVPMRCVKCERAYETRAFNGYGMVGNKILPESVFRRVPLSRGECGMCDG